jgi:MoaA/NifB/PqqE/SkfB family radical SAM enzyme
MKLYNKTPNFSIIMPGDCNANCNFCTWKRCENESPDFLKNLEHTLDDMKEVITQVSITGGEPTLSPVFKEVLDILRGRGLKVVLTTNGSGLRQSFFSRMRGVVDHLNISRHHEHDDSNMRIFSTKGIPSVLQLTYLCSAANVNGIDVTLNQVIDDSSELYSLVSFVSFAKRVGATAVCFRKNHSLNSLDKTLAEREMKIIGFEERCPVCVTNTYLIKGMYTYLKTSLEEPSEHINEVFEFVFQPDGILYEDWNFRKPIKNLN